MKCVVNWIPLRICVRSRNTPPHLKSVWNQLVLLQPVPWKMRLEMLNQMVIEILNGGGF